MSKSKGIFGLFERGRIPPQSVETEQAVLGATLLEAGAMDRVEGILKPEMFYKEHHRHIFEACQSLAASSQPIDLFTVKAALERAGTLEKVGLYYLAEITEKVASSGNIEHHAIVVAQKWMKREQIRVAMAAVEAGYDETVDPFDYIGTMRVELDAIDGIGEGNEIVHAPDLVEKVVRNVEKAMRGEAVYFKTGFPEMDGEYAYAANEVVVIAGRPGMGKTALAWAWAKNLAEMGIPTLYGCLEMKDMEIIARDLASSHGLSGLSMRTGRHMTGDLLVKMTEYAPRYKNIYLKWMPNTIQKLRRAIRATRKKISLPRDTPMVVFLDYLQLMDGEGGTTEEKVSNISRGLKLMAGEENVLMVPLSQLSRAVETRGGDKRPQLSDLRSSGSIEQDADWVLFAYRPEYYGLDVYEDGSSTKGSGEITFAKVRMGKAGASKMLAFLHGQWRSFEHEAQTHLFPRGVVNNDPFTMPIDTSMARHKQDGQFENDLEQFQERYNG